MRWLVLVLALVPALLALFALHVLTAEDAVVSVGEPASATAHVDPAGPVAALPAVDDPAISMLAEAPGALQDPWAAGCLLSWPCANQNRRLLTAKVCLLCGIPHKRHKADGAVMCPVSGFPLVGAAPVVSVSA